MTVVAEGGGEIEGHAHLPPLFLSTVEGTLASLESNYKKLLMTRQHDDL